MAKISAASNLLSGVFRHIVAQCSKVENDRCGSLYCPDIRSEIQSPNL
jgi:hypothetical protein